MIFTAVRSKLNEFNLTFFVANWKKEHAQEWTVVDGETGLYTVLTATSQKKAILKGLEKGYRPSSSTEVRPRTGDAELMNREGFDEWMKKN